MSTMISEVYDALIAAGAPEDKAKKAAEVLSNEQLASKDDVKALRRDMMIALGFVIAVMPAGFGYVVSLLNTIVGKI